MQQSFNKVLYNTDQMHFLCFDLELNMFCISKMRTLYISVLNEYCLTFFLFPLPPTPPKLAQNHAHVEHEESVYFSDMF